MTDVPRLIEYAFPLKQASLDSVHEKNVRHGHISTLHIWPARRPLAACRAALIATLLPDPGTPEKRKALCEKIGGKVVKKTERKKMPNGEVIEREKEVTEGGILHWGQENKDSLAWFRQEIRTAYGGRAPTVLDPFAGGGAIPLEAMRLGCEATAVDINPVAWLILKCTLEYPEKLAGKTHPLPDFILDNGEFMAAFRKANQERSRTSKRSRKQPPTQGFPLFDSADRTSGDAPEADLAWHVRAWGQWVLGRARRELAKFYPTYADFEPLESRLPKPYEKQPMRLVPLKHDGTPDIAVLNAALTREYLADGRNPRWVAKPTAAYLWARTASCKNCRATIPLLKTRWLSKKDTRRVLLTLAPNAERTSVVFGIATNVPIKGGNAAQRREHDRAAASGTMTRSGVTCPCCGLPCMTMDDLRMEGRASRLGTQMTAVMTEGHNSREYRLPTQHELRLVAEAEAALDKIFTLLPCGRLDEPLAPASTRSISCDLYGIDTFGKVFSERQQLALGHLTHATRGLRSALHAYPVDWREALYDLLSLNIDRVADRSSTFCRPDPTPTQSGVINTFSRFALPMTWDFIEGVPISSSSGGYVHSLEWIAKVVEYLAASIPAPAIGCVLNDSATRIQGLAPVDLVVTDPPYYQAISYADLSAFFYVWQRRLHESRPEFMLPTIDKTEEAVQHVRKDKSTAEEKQKYERLIASAFEGACASLSDAGLLVCVFAHKQPDAWETLVSSMIRAGFVVKASWPVQTEMTNRGRAIGSSALASSVWLVCRKRPSTARPGWDNQVLEDMRRNIREKLREFWDAGIRGPDFVWAATGPALEAYSKHPVVKKANEPGPMTVSEFLTHVRRMVVDFVVGRVLSGDEDAAAGADEMDALGRDRLDEPTAYYLLHRHDFGLDEAPAGACILYAISCGVSDKDLSDSWGLISFTKGASTEEGEEEVADVDAEVNADVDEESGNKVKLKTWMQRKTRSLGYEAPGGKPIPLIDRVHCLMHLWKAGDLHKVDEYLDGNGLRRHELFKRLLQSLIELSPHGSEERSLLESISNHLQARGAVGPEQLGAFTRPSEESEGD